MDEKQLSEIKARCEKATPGPWDAFVLHADGVIITVDGRFEIRTPDYDVCAEIPGSAPIRRLSDAEFIAHAREDVPALVAEVERLREAMQNAMNNLGVPGPDYLAPVTVAYRILDAALKGEGEK